MQLEMSCNPTDKIPPAHLAWTGCDGHCYDATPFQSPPAQGASEGYSSDRNPAYGKVCACFVFDADGTHAEGMDLCESAKATHGVIIVDSYS